MLVRMLDFSANLIEAVQLKNNLKTKFVFNLLVLLAATAQLYAQRTPSSHLFWMVAEHRTLALHPTPKP